MTGTRDRSRSDETRAKLLRAATTAFAEKGFHATTTRDIATAAGMSPAAVYVHHRSKEELLHLISRAGHETTLELIRAAVRSTSDPAEQLTAVIREFAVHHARAHTTARIVNYELAALSPEHHAEIRELRRAISAELRALIQRGIDAGVFRTPHADMAATALLSLGIDIARWYRTDGQWSPDDIGGFYADLALRMVGAG
ncbi:TetR/AcrR family transcriptional regulator [Pseudonocardia sp. C8]|uniref:TetR/AcrR family transcriptional regulator n=1 Tax=Pseudonocardia sp. C8 TaxID=2762759 RepID=UPI0016423965|nr:TetR/AcrR family transcriptional regulator [Pseudonocardia sp. C8]MBC3190370.1 TetR/AcrR family transcriptional regulator [Pseudonocardia sp. C8]